MHLELSLSKRDVNLFLAYNTHIQVTNDDGAELAILRAGCVFGEVGVLQVPGRKTGNRRIGNVQSVGYSDCFSLSKADMWKLDHIGIYVYIFIMI